MWSQPLSCSPWCQVLSSRCGCRVSDWKEKLKTTYCCVVGTLSTLLCPFISHDSLWHLSSALLLPLSPVVGQHECVHVVSLVGLRWWFQDGPTHSKRSIDGDIEHGHILLSCSFFWQFKEVNLSQCLTTVSVQWRIFLFNKVNPWKNCTAAGLCVLVAQSAFVVRI